MSCDRPGCSHAEGSLLAFELSTSFRLASATLSVTIDGKGPRVDEYMFLDAILPLRRNVFVKYLLAKAKKRIDMLERNTRGIEMYIAKHKSEPSGWVLQSQIMSSLRTRVNFNLRFVTLRRGFLFMLFDSLF